jgi:hypothetical protein
MATFTSFGITAAGCAAAAVAPQAKPIVSSETSLNTRTGHSFFQGARYNQPRDRRRVSDPTNPANVTP